MEKNNSNEIKRGPEQDLEKGKEILRNTGDFLKKTTLDGCFSKRPVTPPILQCEKNYQSEEKLKQLGKHAVSSRMIAHVRVKELLKDFVAHKKNHGSKVEKEFYQNIDLLAFIERLLVKRPLVFYSVKDESVLRDGNGLAKKCFGGFERIGQDDQQHPLVLTDYLSYEEMELAAFLGVSSLTEFANDGDYSKQAFYALGKAKSPDYEKTGVIVGLVGARFEKPGVMEYKHMVVSAEQNTKQNGYGRDGDPAKQLALEPFAKFYKQKIGEKWAFPSYEEVEKIYNSNPNNSVYHKFSVDGKDIYFNKAIYKECMRLRIEAFLFEAISRAKEAGKRVYIRAVGLGLGNWLLGGAANQSFFANILVAVYKEILSSLEPLVAASIATIEFVYHGEQANHFHPPVSIKFTRQNVAAKLQDNDAQELLLVTAYAWDGNAHANNEFWLGQSTSSDAATGWFTQTSLLHNPIINPSLLYNGCLFYSYGVARQDSSSVAFDDVISERYSFTREVTELFNYDIRSLGNFDKIKEAIRQCPQLLTVPSPLTEHRGMSWLLLQAKKGMHPELNNQWLDFPVRVTLELLFEDWKPENLYHYVVAGFLSDADGDTFFHVVAKNSGYYSRAAVKLASIIIANQELAQILIKFNGKKESLIGNFFSDNKWAEDYIEKLSTFLRILLGLEASRNNCISIKALFEWSQKETSPSLEPLTTYLQKLTKEFSILDAWAKEIRAYAPSKNADPNGDRKQFASDLADRIEKLSSVSFSGLKSGCDEIKAWLNGLKADPDSKIFISTSVFSSLWQVTSKTTRFVERTEELLNHLTGVRSDFFKTDFAKNYTLTDLEDSKNEESLLQANTNKA